MKRPDNINGYEQQWQKAFADAEMSPTDEVWNGIELGLAKEANSNFKKRIFFFKLLAAASVSLAAIVGVTYIVDRQGWTLDKDPSTISDAKKAGNDQANIPVEGESKAQDTGLNAKGKTPSIAADENNKKEKIELLNNAYKASGNQLSSGNESRELAEVSQEAEGIFEPRKTDPDYLDRIGIASEISGELSDIKMNYVPRLEYMHSRKKGTADSWVGVGLAMGNNSPAASSEVSTSTLSASSFNNVADAQNARISDEQGGTVYSAGLSMGMQLDRRWIIEGGLNYVQRNTFVESNLAFGSSGQANRVFSADALTESSDLVVTQNYEIKNTYNSISLPIQAGYLLVDGRFDLLLKGGVSNEILLWNRVEDTSNQLETVTVKSGDDSQYNTFILSGLVGTELRYLLGDRYYISVTPQAQKSINSVTNSEANAESRPLIFVMGFKFKYLLK